MDVVHPLGTALAVLPTDERIANGAHSTTGPMTTFDDRDVDPRSTEPRGCSEAGEAGAHHDHPHAVGQPPPVSVAATFDESSPERRRMPAAKNKTSNVMPSSTVAIAAMSGLRTVFTWPST